MNKKLINIIAAVVAVLALAGCSTTPQVSYSHEAPIMSAADAKSMIHIEVKQLQASGEEPVIVAAAD